MEGGRLSKHVGLWGDGKGILGSGGKSEEDPKTGKGVCALRSVYAHVWCVYIHVCTRVYVCAYVCACVWCMYMCVHVCMHVCMYVRTCMCGCGYACQEHTESGS